MSREETDLATHVEICAIRYQGIQQQIERIEQRMDKLEETVKDLRDSSSKSFGEIKQMLSVAKDEKFKIMVTSTATVIVALIGMLGYLVTHIAR